MSYRSSKDEDRYEFPKEEEESRDEELYIEEVDLSSDSPVVPESGSNSKQEGKKIPHRTKSIILRSIFILLFLLVIYKIISFTFPPKFEDVENSRVEDLKVSEEEILSFKELKKPEGEFLIQPKDFADEIEVESQSQVASIPKLTEVAKENVPSDFPSDYLKKQEDDSYSAKDKEEEIDLLMKDFVAKSSEKSVDTKDNLTVEKLEKLDNQRKLNVLATDFASDHIVNNITLSSLNLRASNSEAYDFEIESKLLKFIPKFNEKIDTLISNNEAFDKKVDLLISENGNINKKIQSKLDELAQDIEDLDTLLDKIVLNLEEKIEKIEANSKDKEKRWNDIQRYEDSSNESKIERKRYSISAIIPGRAWLMSDDGESLTVTNFDEIPGLGRVMNIDHVKGSILTDRQIVID